MASPVSSKGIPVPMDPWPTADVMKKQTAVFVVPPKTRTVDIAEALVENGHTDILSVQVMANRSCKATLRNRDSFTVLCTDGFVLDGEKISASALFPDDTQVQVFDVPIWIPDSVIVSALSTYGAVVDDIRHGSVRTKTGIVVSTGVRFISFRLRKNTDIPSYVCADFKNSFRVRYTGQPSTCRTCSKPGHMAASCPTRGQSSYASATKADQSGTPPNLDSNEDVQSSSSTGGTGAVVSSQPSYAAGFEKADHNGTPTSLDDSSISKTRNVYSNDDPDRETGSGLAKSSSMHCIPSETPPPASDAEVEEPSDSERATQLLTSMTSTRRRHASSTETSPNARPTSPATGHVRKKPKNKYILNVEAEGLQ